MTGELASDEVLRCEVAGERRDPAGAWLSVANNPITRARFAELVSTHARDATMAATHIRRDLTQEPTRP